MKKKQLLLIALFFMVGFFWLGALVYNEQQTEVQSQAALQNQDALIRDHSVRKGSPDAKVTIVEFLDPACGTCKQFHPLVNELLEMYDGKVNLVVRYAPLHRGSDQMVAILEVVRKQNQFWNVLDIMFEYQEFWAINHQARPDLFWGYLKGYGFDVDQIKTDMQSSEVKSVVQQDIADGLTLGATKTPTFFVNGKPLASFGYQQLKNLIESEISANY